MSTPSPGPPPSLDPAPSAVAPSKAEAPAVSPFNGFALVMILLLVVGGWFMVDQMSEASKLQDCVMAGRKNCAPIGVGR